MTSPRATADVPEGKPQLVLLPGTLCDEELWSGQIQALRDVAQCLVPDLTRGVTIEELARSVLDAARPTFSLAGFSLGGYVAQEILRQAPERVERLALIDTSIHADDPARLAARKALDASARSAGTFNGITDRLLDRYVASSRKDDVQLARRIRAMTLRVGRDAFIRQNALVRIDGQSVMRGLRCPLLVMCGAEDVLTPPQGHRDIAGMVPGSTLVEVPGCGHMAPLERPDVVSAALRNWLATGPAPNNSRSILP